MARRDDKGPGRAPWALLAALACAAAPITEAGAAKWGVPPEGWGDFRFALADDNTQYGEIDAAAKAGTKIYGRYRYLNAGVDSNSNWYSYVGPHGAALKQFESRSQQVGVQSSFVIYMLQEDGGYDAFIRNAQNPAFTKAYFWNLEWVARTMAGKNCVLVIEPDTWGYLLQHEHGRLGVTSAPQFGKSVSAMQARVGDIGYPHLAGLPNTVAGLLRGIVKTFREFAPDARIGFHVNTWAWYPPAGGDARGMPYWPQASVDLSADINAHFLKNLFGGAADMGDFVVVEKYGLDAGYIKSNDGSAMGSRYYWNDEHNAKWVGWCKRLAQAVDMPLLGWQIPIGHMGLPNTANRWQDTFMEYFFANPAKFMDAGFIGLWVGKGLPQGTDYSASAGKGDGGKLFESMRAFDTKRPYLLPPGSSLLARAAAPSPARPLARLEAGSLAFRMPVPSGRGGQAGAWRSAAGRRSASWRIHHTPRQGTLP